MANFDMLSFCCAREIDSYRSVAVPVLHHLFKQGLFISVTVYLYPDVGDQSFKNVIELAAKAQCLCEFSERQQCYCAN